MEMDGNFDPNSLYSSGGYGLGGYSLGGSFASSLKKWAKGGAMHHRAGSLHHRVGVCHSCGGEMLGGKGTSDGAKKGWATRLAKRAPAVVEQVVEQFAEVPQVHQVHHPKITVPQLKALAKHQGIKGFSKMKKAQLLNVVSIPANLPRHVKKTHKGKKAHKKVVDPALKELNKLTKAEIIQQLVSIGYPHSPKALKKDLVNILYNQMHVF